jgi:acyl dehydratase
MSMYLEDFEVGQVFGSGQVTVTEGEIIRFASQFDPGKSWTR